MGKIAAVWARVSTKAQTEQSLDSQVAEVKPWLESLGWTIPPERIFMVDWTSKDILRCPDMRTLLQWIRNREIGAVGTVHLDRYSARPGQMAQILDTFRDAGVELLAKATPLPSGLMGEVMALVSTIAKSFSVEKANVEGKRGLHNRAKYRKLPTSHHRVFGYDWAAKTPDEAPKEYRRLEQNHDWPTLKLIFNMALNGCTYHPIIKELEGRGILSPSGMRDWNKSAISAFLHNPVYGGRYYALKKQAVEPKKRQGNTYGNSSQRKLPLEQSYYLPEIEVVNPPITWGQWLQIQDQLKKHQKLSSRNSKADYLLRGFILCETHRGKKGEPRRYHGRPHYNSWCYVCPVGGCTYPYFNGPKIEEWAKLYTQMLISLQPKDFYERISNLRNRDELEQNLRNELHSLEAKYNRSINAETELESRNLLGLENEEVYRRLKTKYQAERHWIEERKEAIGEELAQLDRHAEAVASLQQIQEQVTGRWSELTKPEWRELFTVLNLEIHIRESDNPDWPDTWPRNAKMVSEDGLIECCFGLPLRTAQIGQIVLNAPEPD